MTQPPDRAEIADNLRRTYDNSAGQRDSAKIEPWKAVERDFFLSMLQQEGAKTLLEIGAGPGHTGRYLLRQNRR